MLLFAHAFFLPWRWRRHYPPKRRFLQNPHDATSKKTAFFIVTAVKTWNPTALSLVFTVVCASLQCMMG
jgi:hypothetical protein